MTRPTNIRVLNAQGVSEPVPRDEIMSGIMQPSAHGGPVDIWLLSEIAWADLEGIAKAHDLSALQYGDRGSPEAGVGILSRRPIHQPEMRVGSRPVPGVRMRPSASGRTCGLPVTAIHSPTGKTPQAQDDYLQHLRGIPGIIGGDFNRDPEWMRDHFARKYRGVGVLGLLVPGRYKASEARAVEVGSDHPAVDVRIERRKP